jgi:hypothetical protein
MIQIILNDEQARLAHSSQEGVELRDSNGQLIGYVARPLGAEVIAVARQRANSAGPWHSTQQVLDHLHSLEQG